MFYLTNGNYILFAIRHHGSIQDERYGVEGRSIDIIIAFFSINFFINVLFYVDEINDEQENLLTINRYFQ
jgi:hypothetical protein